MKEKEVKNEVNAKETAIGFVPDILGKENKDLSPQEIHERKKMLV